MYVRSVTDGNVCASTGESCSVFSFFQNEHKPICDGAEARYRRCRRQTGARGSVLTDIELGTKISSRCGGPSFSRQGMGQAISPALYQALTLSNTNRGLHCTTAAGIYMEDRASSTGTRRQHRRNYVAFVSEAMWDENWLHKMSQRVWLV